MKITIENTSFRVRRKPGGGPFVEVRDDQSHFIATVEMRDGTIVPVEGELEPMYIKDLTNWLYIYYPPFVKPKRPAEPSRR